MIGKSLGQLEEHAFFILFTAFILILFWHAVWGILDKIETVCERRFNVTKFQFNILSLLVVILIIRLFPMILQKL